MTITIPRAYALPLGRMQKLVAKAMVQSWTQVPHVTHHDWADVETIEVHRRANPVAGKPVGALAYYMRGVSAALREHPKFNAVFDADTATLWQKEDCNIGIAIAIPDGLMVGVIRDCDTKGTDMLSGEIASLAAKARSSGLSYSEMTDGGFTISSLGANGGDGFTPIVNVPQVAILGIGRLQERAVRGAGESVAWRRMIPLSLSYDHRVIGGADAAQFLTTLKAELADPDGG